MSRLNVAQEVYVINVTIQDQSPDFDPFYSQPLLHDFKQIKDVRLNKLTVCEHHKVRSEYDIAEAEAIYDGYILKDDAGVVFHNQYPVASYGQMSDTANRRYNVAHGEDESLEALLKRTGSDVYEYHLLTDLLKDMSKGIIVLSKRCMMKDCSPDLFLKTQLLVKAFDKIVTEFETKYPGKSIQVSAHPLLDFDDNTEVTIVNTKDLDVSFFNIKKYTDINFSDLGKQQVVKLLTDGCHDFQHEWNCGPFVRRRVKIKGKNFASMLMMWEEKHGFVVKDTVVKTVDDVADYINDLYVEILNQ